MSEAPTHRVEREGAVATVTLDRPDALNAQTRASRLALARDLRALAADEAVRCVVLTGAGRAFCAGQDLREPLEHVDEVIRETYVADHRDDRRHAEAGDRGDQRCGGRGGPLARACLRPPLHGRGRRADDGVLEHRARARLRRLVVPLALDRLCAGVRARRRGRRVGAEEALALDLVQRVLPRERCCLPHRRPPAGSRPARRWHSAGRSG